MKTFTFDPDRCSFSWVRLIQINKKGGTSIRIADCESAIAAGGYTWQPAPGLQVSAIREIINGDEQSMQIDFAHSVGGIFDTAEIKFGMYDGERVFVWIVDREDLPDDIGTGFVRWGKVQPVTLAYPNVGTFDVRSLKEQAVSKGRTFQPMCDTFLFSPFCQLVRSEWDHPATIFSFVDAHNVIISNLGPSSVFHAGAGATGWFDLGKIVAASGIIFEIAHWDASTNQLTTLLPVCALTGVGVVPGTDVTLRPGCDKLMGTCASKFGNNLNFQGFDLYRGVTAVTG